VVIRTCECGNDLSFGACPRCGEYDPNDLAAEPAVALGYGGLRILSDLGLLVLPTPATSMTVGQYGGNDDPAAPEPGWLADLNSEWYDT